MKFFEKYVLKKLKKLKGMIVTNQEKIDDFAAQFKANADQTKALLVNIQGDVNKLAADAANGVPLDFTPLQTSLQAALDNTTVAQTIADQTPDVATTSKGK